MLACSKWTGWRSFLCPRHSRSTSEWAATLRCYVWCDDYASPRPATSSLVLPCWNRFFFLCIYKRMNAMHMCIFILYTRHETARFFMFCWIKCMVLCWMLWWPGIIERIEDTGTRSFHLISLSITSHIYYGVCWWCCSALCVHTAHARTPLIAWSHSLHSLARHCSCMMWDFIGHICMHAYTRSTGCEIVHKCMHICN